MTQFEVLCDMLKYRLKYNQKKISDFTEAMTVSPINALEWSTDAFEAAAQVYVLQAAIKALCDEQGKPQELKAVADFKFAKSVDVLRSAAFEQVSQRSRYPMRSTSVVCNFANECKLMAWAELLKDLEDM